MSDNFEIFHVHTFRCKHAEMVSDEEYIKKAIELNAKRIVFTDHAPFPGDPFGHRMDMSEFDEYVTTLNKLKEQYKELIQVVVGVEVEYFPGFHEYYKELSERLDMLLLGQHMAEIPGGYSFSLGKKELDDTEFKLLGNAIVQGIKTGYFSVVAHPDRIYRRNLVWDEEKEKMAVEIIQAAKEYNVALEQNKSSKLSGLYKDEFWELVPEGVKVITGYDAHFLSDL